VHLINTVKNSESYIKRGKIDSTELMNEQIKRDNNAV
jgi:hypothetical protein